MFSSLMFQNLLEHLIDCYRNITAVDLETNNLQMNELIDSSLAINKFPEWVDNWIQYADDGKTPYMTAQVIKKVHNAILASGL